MFNKTHIYLLFFFIMFSISAMGQSNGNVEEQLTLDYFEGTAVIQFEDNQTIKFQKGSTSPFKAGFTIKNNVVHLKNLLDTVKVKEVLGLTTIAIPAIKIQNEFKGLSAIEQLMNIAHRNNNHKLILVGGGTVSDVSSNENPEQEELIVAPAQNKPDTENTYLIPILFAGGGILLGFLVGWLAKKPQQVTTTIEKEVYVDRIVQKESNSKKTTASKKNTDTSDELAKLQQQVTDGKANIKELKQQADKANRAVTAI